MFAVVYRKRFIFGYVTQRVYVQQYLHSRGQHDGTGTVCTIWYQLCEIRLCIFWYFSQPLHCQPPGYRQTCVDYILDRSASLLDKDGPTIVLMLADMKNNIFLGLLFTNMV